MARLESELPPRLATETPRTQTFELLDHSHVAPGLFELSFNLDGSKVNKLSPTDIEVNREVQDSEEGTELAADGQTVLEKLGDLPFPIIAANNGASMGGGTEL